MPGAELVEVIGENAWKAKLHVKLGPIALQFLADVTRERDGRDGRAGRARGQGARGEGPRQRRGDDRVDARRRGRRHACRHRHRADAPRRGRPVRPRRRRRRRVPADGAVRRLHRGASSPMRLRVAGADADRRDAPGARLRFCVPCSDDREVRERRADPGGGRVEAGDRARDAPLRARAPGARPRGARVLALPLPTCSRPPGSRSSAASPECPLPSARRCGGCGRGARSASSPSTTPSRSSGPTARSSRCIRAVTTRSRAASPRPRSRSPTSATSSPGRSSSSAAPPTRSRRR